MAKHGKGKGKRAARRAVSIKVSYKGLHRQLDLLQKKLAAVRRRLKTEGMPQDRVDFVLESLEKCEGDTKCQRTMVEEF